MRPVCTEYSFNSRPYTTASRLGRGSALAATGLPPPILWIFLAQWNTQQSAWLRPPISQRRRRRRRSTPSHSVKLGELRTLRQRARAHRLDVRHRAGRVREVVAPRRSDQHVVLDAHATEAAEAREHWRGEGEGESSGEGD